MRFLRGDGETRQNNAEIPPGLAAEYPSGPPFFTPNLEVKDGLIRVKRMKVGWRVLAARQYVR